MAQTAEPGPEEVEIGGEHFEVDRDLTALLNSGPPAVLTGCQHQKQVIKQDRLFLVFNNDGAVYDNCGCGMGLYREDTRFIDRLTFRLGGQAPTLLDSSTEQTNIGIIELVNPPFVLENGTKVPQETIHITLTRVVSEEFRERLRFVNYNAFDVTLHIELEFMADFADIFEVRGLPRNSRGTLFRAKTDTGSVSFLYQGGDGIARQARIVFDRPASQVRRTPGLRAAVGATAEWTLEVPGNAGESSLEYRIWLSEGDSQTPTGQPFNAAVARATAQNRHESLFATQLHGNNEIFNLAIDRCFRDLIALTSSYPSGPFISAGIPWFTCPFGRDALITVLQTLWLGPDLARGVLRYLAMHQGLTENDYRDEQPGKMLHEHRFGELAKMNLVPHSPYFGTIDATPLWLILLSETYRWTGDLALVIELWDHVEAALLWIDTYADIDGDGLYEYQSKSTKGIRNQGWKDSFNAIIFPNGALAESPIALAEMQGYVYDAKCRIAELCLLVGQEVLAQRLVREALALKNAYNQTFWMADQAYFALALDRDKRTVPSICSNPGHGLWSDIIAPEYVGAVIARLLEPDMFSGWGIRTLSASSPVYNPMGYHIGSVWPHDNALIAKGMADRGYKHEANRIFTALFESSLHFPYYRLPELFCGFGRQGEFARPSPYPVACSPQAWAAGAPMMALQAALGLEADAANRTLKLRNPTLPAWLDELSVKGLKVGNDEVDLDFLQIKGVTTTRIQGKKGHLQILIEG